MASSYRDRLGNVLNGELDYVREMYLVNCNQISFIPSGLDPLTQTEGRVTPFIGYAVFEGDIVNVSHLQLHDNTENKTMWSGERVYIRNVLSLY